jgi:hypothetical protein
MDSLSRLLDRFRFSPSRSTRKNTYATKLIGNRRSVESNSSSSSSNSERSGSRSSKRSGSSSSKRSGSEQSGTNSNAAYVSSGEMRRRKAVKATKRKTAREIRNEDVMKVKLPKDMGYRAAMDNRAFKYRVEQLKHNGYKFHEARGGFAVFTRAVKA